MSGPRGPRSTIEQHPERARIELAIAQGVSARVIGLKFGASKDAVSRHKQKMPGPLKAALAGKVLKPGVDLEKLRVDESEGLLSHVVAQRGRLYLMLDQCEQIGDTVGAARLHAEINKNLTLGSKLLGLLVAHSKHISVNLTVSAEYLELRQALVNALQPYPEARRAVAAVLRQVEGTAAPEGREIVQDDGRLR